MVQRFVTLNAKTREPLLHLVRCRGAPNGMVSGLILFDSAAEAHAFGKAVTADICRAGGARDFTFEVVAYDPTTHSGRLPRGDL